MIGPIDVVLLAGDRRPSDPLAIAAGVRGKALVPAAGRSLLSRVIEVVSSWPRLGRLVLVAAEHDEYRAAVTAGSSNEVDLTWQPPQASLSDSVRLGLRAAGSVPRLVLTADHALLDPSWLDALLLAAERAPRATALVGVTDWDAVMARFPGSRRTRYRFRDRSICGTNLFAVRPAGLDRLLDTWQGVEQQRKRPWRIIHLLGWRTLAAYLAGRLSLDQAFAALSHRLGIEIVPVLLEDPLTAVDVDTAADLALVESVLRERDQWPC